MYSNPMQLWPLLDQLGRSAPFTKESIEARLGIRLVPTAQNEFTTFYEGGPVKLANGVVISKVDLRLKRQGGHPGFMVLSLAGNCVTLADVRQHYAQLDLVDVPRGRSINEVTSVESNVGWGSIGFSFPVTKAECVGTVSLQPTM